MWLAISFILMLFFAPPAFAVCTNPDGIPGELMYNGSYDVFQGCTIRGWMAFGGGGSCSGGGLSGPADCPEIGDQCTDMTIFAGLHPVTHDYLFIPPTDQEKPGSPGTFTMQWKKTRGIDDINLDSYTDGSLNHANRSGAIADFPAFQACEDLVLAGKNWYLPSRTELDHLYNNKTALQSGPMTNFQNAYYRTSTEGTIDTAWIQNLTSGDSGDNYKNNTGDRVRCMAR